MRKYTNVALEEIVLPNQMLSMEAAALLFDESNIAASEIKTDVSDAQRVLDMSDSFGDLAVIAGQMKEVSKTQAGLFNTVTQIAVAGTGLTPDDVIPSMSESINGTVAVEGFLTKAHSLFDTIMRYLKVIWERIDVYFKVHATLPLLKAKLLAQITVANSLGNQKEFRKLTKLRIGATSISADGKVLTKSSDLLKVFSNTRTAAEYVFTDYAKNLTKKAQVVTKAIGVMYDKHPKEVAVELRNELKNHENPRLPGSSSNLGNYGDFDVWEGQSLLGNVHLRSQTYAPKKELSILGSLERFRRSSVTVSSSGNTFLHNNEALMVETLSPGNMVSLLNDAIIMLNHMEVFYKGSQYRELKGAKLNLERASMKATAMMNKSISENVYTTGLEGPNNTDYYRSLINFNLAYAGWIHDPIVTMYQRGIASIKTVLAIVVASSKAYDLKA